MHKVGFVELAVVDRERRNWSGDGPRPVRCSVWYPAEDTSAEEVVLLPPDRPLFVMGSVARNALPSRRFDNLPVVLLSHGTGGSAASLGWLARRLAANGFVVIGVDHHGNTASEPYRAEGFLCWWERPRDLTVALDAIAARGFLAGRLDMSGVAAVGFSLGGHTVLSLAGAITDMALFREWAAKGKPTGRGPREFPDLSDRVAPLLEESLVFRQSWERQSATNHEPRVRRVLAIAPAPPVRGFKRDSLQQIGSPVSIVVGEADIEAPAGDCSRWLHAHLPHCTLDILAPDIGHYTFLCEGTEAGQRVEPDIWADPPGVDRRGVHIQTSAIALRALRPGCSGGGIIAAAPTPDRS